MDLDFLIIDDDEDALFINEYIISKAQIGRKIYKADNVPNALSLLRKLKKEQKELPQVILLDIRMPVLDGFAFLQKFNRLPKHIREICKVIMVTSSVNLEDYQKAMENPNVIGYISKPLTLEKIESLAEKIPFKKGIQLLQI